MRAASSGLLTHLDSNIKFDVATLYDFTLIDGTLIHWTSYYQNLTIGGTTYLCRANGAPAISRTGGTFETGLVVSDMEITLGVGQPVGGAPTIPGAGAYSGMVVQLAAVRGAFARARVLVSKLFMPTPGDTSLGTLPWWAGVVADPQPSSTAVRLSCKSSPYLLAEMQIPRHVFQPPCTRAIYDSGCGVVKHPTLCTVQAGSTATSVIVDVQPVINYQLGDFSGALGADTWKLGTLTVNKTTVGIRTSSAPSGGKITLTLGIPLPAAPAAGAAASLLLGCDKSYSGGAGCVPRFNNSNHRGFPFVPQQESVI